MKCPNCKMIEMTVENVSGNKVKHICRNCGNEEITELQENVEVQESI